MKNKQLIDAWDAVTPGEAERSRVLQNITQQSIQSKPRFQPRHVLALSLLIVAVLGATAFALSEGGLIDWFGKKVTDHLPLLIEDVELIATIQSRTLRAKDLLAQAPEDELWIAEIWENTQITSSPSRSFDSAKALAAHLASSGLPFPTHMPAGYTFESGNIASYLSKNTAANGLLPLPDWQTDAGFTIKKYRLTTDYSADIDHWHATFRDDKGNVLFLTGFRDSHSTQYSFNTNASGEHTVLTIPGMAEALYIRNVDNRFEHSLNFRQTGLPRSFYYNWYSPRETPDIILDPNYYDSLVYQFESNTLGQDALLKIANSFK